MRLQIAAANWKMNTSLQDGVNLCENILAQVSVLEENRNARIIIAPPFTHIADLTRLLKQYSGNPRFASHDVCLAAQNCSDTKSGALTGEVSAAMVKSTGARYVIIGHSERRSRFHEDEKMLAEKVNRVLENNMSCIYCCGETLKQRKEGNFTSVVRQQVTGGLSHITPEQCNHIVIAYEPVWAIGTGVNATPQQAQEMHRVIRNLIAEKYGMETAGNISLLYGGSCNPKNAKDLFACPDIDGGLIGGASLNANDFAEIVKCLKKN